MLLMTRPRVRGDHVGTAGLEDLDQVADRGRSSISLDRAVKATMSAKPTVSWVRVEVLLAGARAPRCAPPRPRGGGARRRPAAARTDSLSSSIIRSAEPRAAAAWPGRPARAARRGARSVPTSQSASRAIVCPTRPGQVDGGVEVEQPRVDQRAQPGDRGGVGGVERRLDAVLGEAQRPPEPARLLDRDAGLLGDLEGVEHRGLTQDRALQPVPGVLRLRPRHGAGAPAGRGWGRGSAGARRPRPDHVTDAVAPVTPSGRRRARARRPRPRRRARRAGRGPAAGRPGRPRWRDRSAARRRAARPAPVRPTVAQAAAYDARRASPPPVRHASYSPRRPASTASSSTVRSGSVPSARASEVAVGTGSSSAVVLTLSPMPTTAAGPVGVSTRSTRMPRDLARRRPARRWATSAPASHAGARAAPSATA